MGSKEKSDKQSFRFCVFFPCPHYFTGGDIHNLCVACLGAEHAWSAIEGADCADCERLPLHTFYSRCTFFKEGEQACSSHSSVAAGAERKLKLWGSQMDQVEGLEMALVFSLSSPSRSSALSQDLETCSLFSSSLRESQTLHLSSSGEADVVSVDPDEAESIHWISRSSMKSCWTFHFTLTYILEC